MLGKVKNWFIGLSKVGKTGVVLASLFVVGAAAGPSPQSSNQAPAPTSPAVIVPEEIKAYLIEKKTFTYTEAVPFEKTTVNDSSLTKGATKIKTIGVNGIKTFTYELTLTNGIQTDKKLVKEEVTLQPVTEVTTIGTKVAAAPKPTSNCDSNYSGACVPIANDVDCAGGSGNGPAYVSGPVYVVGSDIYDLDRDGNGVGCES